MTEMATMTLRPAQTTDAEPIAALFTEEGYPAGPSDIVARLGRFDHEHGWVIVAEHEGALLGFIALHAVPGSSMTTGSSGSWPSSSTPAPASVVSGARSWPRPSGSGATRVRASSS